MSSWARSRERSISRLPDREHEGHDEHEQREQQDRVDRDLPALARARSRHQWVTSLRVTNSDASGRVQVPRNGTLALLVAVEADPDRLAPAGRRRRRP